jgi:hypothetical protein
MLFNEGYAPPDRMELEFFLRPPLRIAPDDLSIRPNGTIVGDSVAH